MKHHISPKLPKGEVDYRAAIFARPGTTSHSFGSHKTTPFECPPGRADSKRKTRQSRYPDSDAQDVETCPHGGCELPRRREKPCGTQPHSTRDPAKMPAERPTTQTSPPRGKTHFE